LPSTGTCRLSYFNQQSAEGRNPVQLALGCDARLNAANSSGGPAPIKIARTHDLLAHVGQPTYWHRTAEGSQLQLQAIVDRAQQSAIGPTNFGAHPSAASAVSVREAMRYDLTSLRSFVAVAECAT